MLPNFRSSKLLNSHLIALDTYIGSLSGTTLVMMTYKPTFNPYCGYLSPSPGPTPYTSAPITNCQIDPSVMTFSEMTNLVDYFRTTRFLPIVQQAQACYPSLSAQECKTLNDIAVGISQYNRSPALDGRGGWAFGAVATDHHIWVAELLLAFGMGTRMYCGLPYISNNVMRAYGFLYELETRIPPL